MSLIVPVLNEELGIRVVMPNVDPAWVDEVLIVDGGSTDATEQACRELGLTFVRQRGRGLHMAMVTALSVSTADVLITFSPDGNSLPELIPQLAEAAKGADMVVASRYMGGARSLDDDRLTAFGNRMFTAMINLLFRTSYTDTLVMLRAYRREALERMRLAEQESESAFRRRISYMNSWEIGSCLRAARLGMRTREIPGDEPARISGVRKLSIVKNGTGALLQILYDFLFFRSRA